MGTGAAPSCTENHSKNIEVIAAFYSINSAVRGYNAYSYSEVELDYSQVILYAGELCPILDITQNGRRFVGTKINPQFLLSAMGNILT